MIDEFSGSWIVEATDLTALLAVLKNKGYRLAGPMVRDGAIVYHELDSADDLPRGWTEEQDAATYRLAKRNDEAWFGFTVGPHSWKKFLHPPVRRLWSAEKTDQGLRVIPENGEIPRWAFIGVRACEISAMRIQDAVFMNDSYEDPDYRARREAAFILSVNCGQAAKTCFCVSMNSGPKADSGFDLSLTEVLEGGRHFFLATVGSERGRDVLRETPHAKADGNDISAADRAVANAEKQMGRSLDTKGLPQLLADNPEHPRWQEVAQRCMTCANCTMVCPTCFCSTVEDVTDVTGEHAERWQKWDSCFTMEFTYLHGGSVRQSAKSRYRQWMTHKLSSWVEQFGTSGCVGCGRCVTWCPVGIDITEEARAIRDSLNTSVETGGGKGE